METVSGCKLPLSLKLRISKLIDEHSFNCGLSLNMDVTSLRNVLKEFQDMKLLCHVCKIDVTTKALVLDIMQAIAQTDPNDHDGDDSDVDVAATNVGPVLSDLALDEVNVVAAKVCVFFAYSTFLSHFVLYIFKKSFSQVSVKACVPSTSKSVRQNVVLATSNDVRNSFFWFFVQINIFLFLVSYLKYYFPGY
jgi:hypothetical protein